MYFDILSYIQNIMQGHISSCISYNIISDHISSYIIIYHHISSRYGYQMTFPHGQRARGRGRRRVQRGELRSIPQRGNVSVVIALASAYDVPGHEDDEVGP